MSVDTNMPILIVDDYKTMLRIIRNLLKQLGFEGPPRVRPGLHEVLHDNRGDDEAEGRRLSRDDWKKKHQDVITKVETD